MLEVNILGIEVLTVSSKGQVVLPVDMRNALSIKPGDKLAAYASDELIMLKVLHRPSVEEFKARLDEAQAWAASVGYTEEDVADIVKRSRKRQNDADRH